MIPIHSPPTSSKFSLTRWSDGWRICPVSFMLPCTVSASSGRSVFTPTRPAWNTDSGVWPFCHRTSTSLSNWPGLDACKEKRVKMIITEFYIDGFAHNWSNSSALEMELPRSCTKPAKFYIKIKAISLWDQRVQGEIDRPRSCWYWEMVLLSAKHLHPKRD